LLLGGFPQMHIVIAWITGLSWDDAHWFDLIMFLVAAMFVFPDKVLEWMADRAGREFGWRHIVWLEVIIVVFLIFATTLLMRFYPELTWRYPLALICIAVGIRGIIWIVIALFGDIIGPDD